MGEVVDKIKQYSGLAVAIMTAIGFSGVFMLYASGAPQAPDQGEEQELNFEIPDQVYTEEGFNKNFQELIVTAAQHNIAITTVIYNNESERENIEDLEGVPQEFNDRAYVQIVPFENAEDLPTQADIEDYPAAVTVSGTISEQGVIPRMEMQQNEVTRDQVERDICNVLDDLQGISAKCQAIGAF